MEKIVKQLDAISAQFNEKGEPELERMTLEIAQAVLAKCGNKHADASKEQRMRLIDKNLTADLGEVSEDEIEKELKTDQALIEKSMT